MADENAIESKPAQSIPERPKEEVSKDAAAPAGDAAGEGDKGPSKNALKKAQKEKEKVSWPGSLYNLFLLYFHTLQNA